MRVKFRIVIYQEGKKLTREDLKDKREPLLIGIRYVLEFKYLEATKWLMLAEDSYEKYLLLGLINEALGQEAQAREFLEEASKYPKITPYTIKTEIPKVSS